MKKQIKNVKIVFRTDKLQAERLQRMAAETGRTQSLILRDIVDSALLIERPRVVSNYQSGPVQHGA